MYVPLVQLKILSLYLLYWYKSTNTDAKGAEAERKGRVACTLTDADGC